MLCNKEEAAIPRRLKAAVSLLPLDGKERGAVPGKSIGLSAGLALWGLLATGCQTVSPHFENPTVVAAQYPVLWETTVEVVERYFDIVSENREFGEIITYPQASSTLLEPWFADTVDFRERLEATLQTIRRRAIIRIQPAPNGLAVNIQVYKELEDRPQPIFASSTAGSVITSIEPIEEQLVTTPAQAQTGWISLGRDEKLEARMIAEIQQKLNSYIYP